MLPAAIVVAALRGPSLVDAAPSWSAHGVTQALLAVTCIGLAAASGGVAAAPLGARGTAAGLAVVAASVVLAVPDTEGPVMVAAALAVAAVGVVLIDGWSVPAPAAAVVAAAVGATALAGATDGRAAAIGGAGCVLVLAGAWGLSPAGPARWRWLATTAVLAAGSLVVARVAAVRSTDLRAALVIAAAVLVVAGALRVVDRVTSGREHPPR